jgi:hypothetical protein
VPNACPAAVAQPGGSEACSSLDGACSSNSRNSGSISSSGSGGSGSNEGPYGCASAPAVSLTVLIGSSARELLRSGASSSSKHVCAANVSALPGLLMEVDCGRLMRGKPGSAFVLAARAG